MDFGNNTPTGNAFLLAHVSEIIDDAKHILPTIAELYQPGRLPCGYLTIRSNVDARVIVVAELNDCPMEKFTGYCRNSMEKGERIFAHPDHVSSAQSRDPDKQQWGGAIRAGEYIVSFSGLPELADEALCVSIAIRFGWIDRDSDLPRQIFEISENTKGLEALRMAA